MAGENRNEEPSGEHDGGARRRPARPGADSAAGDRRPAGDAGAPVSVPAQRTGPSPAPLSEASPPVPPPPARPPVTPPQASPSAVPSDDPSATGRSGGSRSEAPSVPPVAPRGRDTTGGADDARDPGYGPLEGALSGGRSGEPATDGAGVDGRLLDEAERDRLGQRLHQVLATFVDAPCASVAEADEVLAEVERHLIASLRDRRTALRAGWRPNGDPDGQTPDTEQLRLALRTYREVTERLLRA